MKIRHKTAIFLNGSLWMSVGTLLIIKSIRYLCSHNGNFLLFPNVENVFSSHPFSITALMLGCIALGWFKGRFALRKAAGRFLHSLLSKPDPCPIASVYSPLYCLLLLLMCCMGIALKWLPIAHDIKGCIDLTVGFALSVGALHFFRVFLRLHRRASQKGFFS